MSERKAAALERLLLDEREMILTGRFDGLAELTPRKLEQLETLPDWDLPALRLSEIAAQVTRNQSLLDGAIRGMKAARLRIETVLGASGSLSTYDSHGRKSDLSAPRTEMRRKA